jgi:alkylhydroperoxidase family enzyme
MDTDMVWLSGLRPEVVNAVHDALNAPGDLTSDLRRAILERAMALGTGVADPPAVPAPFTDLVDKIAQQAHQVVDRDVQVPAEAGFSQDAVFEAVVASAIGAGMARLTSGLAVLQQLPEDAGRNGSAS